jgi:hypothetical protein
MWQRRDQLTARAVLAAMAAATGGWDFVLLGRVSWAPGLRWVVLAAGLAAAAALMVPARALGRAAVVVVAVTSVATVSASTAWAVSSAGVAQTSSSPTAGPAGVATGGFGGGFPGGLGDRQSQPSATAAGGAGLRGEGGGTVDAALVALLQSTGTRWAAAATGSMQAAPLQLASGKAVMSIGGFTGSDPAPTLAQFQQYVAAGQVRYYVSTGQGGGARGGNGGQGYGTAIAQWVAAHYTATTVGGATVYDLTAPTGS